MKNKRIRIIIIVTFTALSGVIITQSFWMTNALQLKQELFNQNVNLGLKSVANQIMLLQTGLDTVELDQANANYTLHKQFILSLEPALIDSMLSTQFRALDVCDEYYYGIFEIATNEFVLVNNPAYAERITESVNQTNISCVFQEDQFALAVYFAHNRVFVINQMQIYILLSVLFILIIIAGFWFIINMLFKQKRISEIKNDFVNNMTHEFKTPIATISVSSEMLMNEHIAGDAAKARQYARIIYDENNRLREQVDHVLQVAMLERRDFQLKLTEFDAHETIEEVISKFEITINTRGGTFHKRLNAARPFINADKNHFTNVVQNLIDNGIKYSPEKPQITVSTRSSNEGFYVEIEDQGIGIEPHNQKLIFEQFHRIHTGDVHDVKGFGIGLYYVKTVTEAHGGAVTVTSRSGRGSNFTVFIPSVPNEISLNGNGKKE